MSASLLAQATGRGAAQGARGAAPAPAADKALAMLQGTWAISSINGQTPAPMSLAFKGDKYEQTVQGTVNERGVIKVDGAKKPVTIDLIIQEGSDAGKLQPGIVEVTGDTMKLKLAFPGVTARPKDFTADQDSLLVTLTKQKSQ
jgi:uncharacterized protein (TIGR03067 family)